MSQRYIPLFDENKNVINPAFFVEGMAEFAGEFNGALNRDNFAANDITDNDIATAGERVFNLMGSDYAFNTDAVYSPNMDVTGWQGGTGNGADGLGLLEFTTEQDVHFDIYWSGEWAWNGSYSWVTAGARPDRTDTFDTLQIRVVADGVPICIAGPYEDGMINGAGYILGSIQFPAGAHTIKVECMVVRRIAQSGMDAGVCTNDVQFESRTIMALGRVR